MRALIIDDHPLFSEGLRRVLAGLEPGAAIECVGTVDQGFRLARTFSPDLTLFDLYMPDSLGIATLQRFITTFPFCPVLIVSACTDRSTIRELLAAGAMGFISKASCLEELRQALACIADGKIYCAALDKRYEATPPSKNGAFSNQMETVLLNRFNLTPRQISVMELIMRGFTNKEIGNTLNCTEGTIKVHVSTILKTLGVKNRTEAVWKIEQALHPLKKLQTPAVVE